MEGARDRLPAERSDVHRLQSDPMRVSHGCRLRGDGCVGEGGRGRPAIQTATVRTIQQSQSDDGGPRESSHRFSQWVRSRGPLAR